MSAAKECVRISGRFDTTTLDDIVDLTQTVPCVFRRVAERLNDEGFQMYSCLKRQVGTHQINKYCSLIG